MNDLVVKRNDLIQKFTTKLNYNQQKILIALIANYVINAGNINVCNDSDSLRISELRDMLGMQKGGAADKQIKKELLTMMEKSILNEYDGEDVIQTAFFEQIRYYSKEEVVKFKWSNSIKPYLINIDGNIAPFTRYLSSTYLKLKSKKAQNLYEVLKSYQNLKVVTITVEKLKFITKCETKTYDKFKDFNRLTLKKCVNEINDLTDLRIEYTAIKKGRSTESVRFSIKKIVSDSDIKFKYGSFENVWLRDEEYQEIKNLNESYIDKLSIWKNKKNIIKKIDDYSLIKKWIDEDNAKKERIPLPEYKSETPTLTPEELEELKNWLKEGKEKGI